MEANGYPWPPMLDCDKFPLDNDMCITSQAEAKQEKRPSQSKTIKTHGKQSLNIRATFNITNHRFRSTSSNLSIFKYIEML